MSLLIRKALVLAKEEATYGTDPVPTAADNAILVSNPVPKVDGEVLTRDVVRATLSPQGHVIGRKKVTVTFETELKGSGTAGVAPETGVLFEGCAMDETIVADTSVTYAPISDNHKSITIYCYFDGLLHKITGCRGSFDIDMSAGQYGKVSWTFEGKYTKPIDSPLPTSPTFDATKPPIIQNAGFSVGGYGAVISKLSLSKANTVVRGNDVNSADAYGETKITGTDANGSFDPLATLVATEDFWGDWGDAADKAITIHADGAAGNIPTVNIGQAEYRELSQGDRDGEMSYEIPFTATGTSAGDDEMSIVFT